MINYKKLLDETKNLSLLFVEDYETLRLDMQEVLEDFFAEVDVAEHGKKALEIYHENPDKYDLIITDIQMPYLNGVELAEKIREMNPAQTIIVLSSHTDSEYLLRLINLGISKFITKPIQDQELFDTLYRESKKLNMESDEEYQRDTIDLGSGYYWDNEKSLLFDGENEVKLTKHEILLLQYFISREGQVCSNSDIIEGLYEKDVDMNEKNVRNLVFKLRKKIPQNCISSVYGLGYKFVSLLI